METILIIIAGIAAFIFFGLAVLAAHYAAIIGMFYFIGCLVAKLFGYMDATASTSFGAGLLGCLIVAAITNPNRRVVVAVRV
jgi:hypothetical protein